MNELRFTSRGNVAWLHSLRFAIGASGCILPFVAMDWTERLFVGMCSGAVLGAIYGVALEWGNERLLVFTPNMVRAAGPSRAFHWSEIVLVEARRFVFIMCVRVVTSEGVFAVATLGRREIGSAKDITKRVAQIPDSADLALPEPTWPRLRPTFMARDWVLLTSPLLLVGLFRLPILAGGVAWLFAGLCSSLTAALLFHRPSKSARATWEAARATAINRRAYR